MSSIGYFYIITTCECLNTWVGEIQMSVDVKIIRFHDYKTFSVMKYIQWNNIFYCFEYTDLYMNLINNFDEQSHLINSILIFAEFHVTIVNVTQNVTVKSL